MKGTGGGYFGAYYNIFCTQYIKLSLHKQPEFWHFITSIQLEVWAETVSHSISQLYYPYYHKPYLIQKRIDIPAISHRHRKCASVSLRYRRSFGLSAKTECDFATSQKRINCAAISHRYGKSASMSPQHRCSFGLSAKT